MIDISKLDKTQLQDLLKSLQQYQDLSRQLGKRGSAWFKRQLGGTSQLKVEYYPSIDVSVAQSQAALVYKKVFDLDVDHDQVNYIAKESLGGGMKVYREDEMVDMSFAGIEAQLRN